MNWKLLQSFVAAAVLTVVTGAIVALKTWGEVAAAFAIWSAMAYISLP